MAEQKAAICRRNSWIVAAAFGALVAVMLVAFAGHGIAKAILIGLILAVLLGLFLVWAFCSGASAPVEVEAPRPPADTVLKPRPFADDADAPVIPAAPLASAPRAEARPSPEPAAAADGVAPEATPAVPRPAARATSDTAFGLNAALAKSKDDPVAAPEMLTAPRGGRPDDLKQIRGIGPKLEALLNEVGVWHFDQIASWKARDIAFVDEKLVGFHGRITRDEWVKQARVLARGGETEFSAKVKKGGVY